MTSPSQTLDSELSLEPFEFTVDTDLNARYLESLEGHHLRYLRGRGGHPPLIPPGLLLNQSNTTRSPSYRVGPTEAGIHAKEETRFVNPAYVGKRLRVVWSFVERYERRGRIYTVTDAVITDEDGREIIRRRAWGTRSSDTAPIERRSEQRAEPAAAGASQPDPTTELGLVLHGRPKTVTLERMRLFSGWPRKNIHTDEETARAAGCPAPIASATQNMGHLCELLIDHFGEEWLTTGTLTLAFTRPIYAGDTITSCAVITGREEQETRTRYELEVRADNQRGMPVTLGRATALW